MTQDGKVVEYYGDIKTLGPAYASGDTSSGVVSLGHYSMEAFAELLDKARNPRVAYDPGACRQLYTWAQKELPLTGSNAMRKAKVFEIMTTAQRGECVVAQKAFEQYGQQYKP